MNVKSRCDVKLCCSFYVYLTYIAKWKMHNFLFHVSGIPAELLSLPDIRESCQLIPLCTESIDWSRWGRWIQRSKTRQTESITDSPLQLHLVKHQWFKIVWRAANIMKESPAKWSAMSCYVCDRISCSYAFVCCLHLSKLS